MHTGACLCNAVSFEVNAKLEKLDACHCIQCRQWTGHFLVSTEVPRSALSINGAENISWFQSSTKVRRGFCAKCGSSLFFDPLDTKKHDWIGVAMGAFVAPTHSAIAVHIFVAEKGDYYELNDGLPQNQH